MFRQRRSAFGLHNLKCGGKLFAALLLAAL